MSIVSSFRLGELFSCVQSRLSVILRIIPTLEYFYPSTGGSCFLPSHLLPIRFYCIPIITSYFIPSHKSDHRYDSPQWSRARPRMGIPRLAGGPGQGPRYVDHRGSRYCTLVYSHCPRMTGVRCSRFTWSRLSAGSRGPTRRSEIILSKLDLDNTSERTCVTLIVPPAVCLHLLFLPRSPLFVKFLI